MQFVTATGGESFGKSAWSGEDFDDRNRLGSQFAVAFIDI